MWFDCLLVIVKGSELHEAALAVRVQAVEHNASERGLSPSLPVAFIHACRPADPGHFGVGELDGTVSRHALPCGIQVAFGQSNGRDVCGFEGLRQDAAARHVPSTPDPGDIAHRIDELSAGRLKRGGCKHDEVGGGTGVERSRDRLTALQGLSIVAAELDSGLDEGKRAGSQWGASLGRWRRARDQDDQQYTRCHRRP